MFTQSCIEVSLTFMGYDNNGNSIASGSYSAFIMCFICFLLLLMTYMYLRRPTEKDLPPGPWGFPVIGHLPFLPRNPQLTFQNWRKQYGEVFRIRIGKWQTVVINGKDAIKEASLKNDDFSARPKFYTMLQVNDNKDLALGQYDSRWLLHRKIANKTFREFVCKQDTDIADLISLEAEQLMEGFLSKSGKTFDPTEEIQWSVGSVIYQLCYGRRKNIRQDEDFRKVISANKDLVAFSEAGNPIDVLPWTKWFMPGKVYKIGNILNRLVSSRQKNIKEHARTYDPESISDLTDAFLLQERILNKTKMDASGLTPQQVLTTLDNLMGAGFINVATVLTWAVKLMAMFPSIQLNVQTELDQIIGKDGCVFESDRERLPYTDATVLEILRFATIVPFSIPHCTTKDTKLNGYFIPEGTVVFVNLHSLSHDEKMWKDPQVFRPERFLTDTGVINKELAKCFFPFGLGRRRCLGERLAKSEIFLFFAKFMQNCTFLKPISVDFNTNGICRLFNKPTKFEVIVHTR